MTEKSYVALEQHQCPICGELFDTGNLLLDRRLKDSLEKYTVTGFSPCPEHQKLLDAGYIAAICFLPNGAGAKGSVMLKKDYAERLFNEPLGDNKIIRIDEGTLSLLQDLLS